MRSIIIFIYIVLLLLVNSCGVEEIVTERPIRKVIKNISTHEVTVDIGNGEVKFVLSPNDSIIFDGVKVTGIDNYVIFDLWEEDTRPGIVVFDNEKKLIYDVKDCDGSKNLVGYYINLTICGFTPRINEDINEYVFTIDNADYELAEPIE